MGHNRTTINSLAPNQIINSDQIGSWPTFTVSQNNLTEVGGVPTSPTDGELISKDSASNEWTSAGVAAPNFAEGWYLWRYPTNNPSNQGGYHAVLSAKRVPLGNNMMVRIEYSPTSPLKGDKWDSDGGSTWASRDPGSGRDYNFSTDKICNDSNLDEFFPGGLITKAGTYLFKGEFRPAKINDNTYLPGQMMWCQVQNFTQNKVMGPKILATASSSATSIAGNSVIGWGECNDGDQIGIWGSFPDTSHWARQRYRTPRGIEMQYCQWNIIKVA